MLAQCIDDAGAEHNGVIAGKAACSRAATLFIWLPALFQLQ
jgi:hypothetical protein